MILTEKAKDSDDTYSPPVSPHYRNSVITIADANRTPLEITNILRIPSENRVVIPIERVFSILQPDNNVSMKDTYLEIFQ